MLALVTQLLIGALRTPRWLCSADLCLSLFSMCLSIESCSISPLHPHSTLSHLPNTRYSNSALTLLHCTLIGDYTARHGSLPLLPCARATHPCLHRRRTSRNIPANASSGSGRRWAGSSSLPRLSPRTKPPLLLPYLARQALGQSARLRLEVGLPGRAALLPQPTLGQVWRPRSLATSILASLPRLC